MSDTLEGNSGTVELPLLSTDAQKRWRVACTAVQSIRAFTLAKEIAVADQGLELQPVLISANWKRWRTVCTTLRSIRAFSLARDARAENLGELSHRLLSPPSDTVINIAPECLIDLVQSKNIDQLRRFGGVTGVASALETDAEKGIQGDVESIARRRKDFGYNKIHQPPPKVQQIVWETFKDPIIIILLVCAALSLVFGIKRHGLKGLHDGGSIFVAVFFVIIVTSSSKLWPRHQFYKLSKAPDGFSIVVIRNGKEQCIPVSEAVVGDVVCLKFGDQVPADGLYIDGNFLQVDESHLGAEMESLEVNDTDNPFLLLGTKVRNGSARMLVTAVGMNSKWGRILSTRRNNPIQSTPLQMKLHKLTILIAMVGLAVASMVLVILLIRYFVGNMHDDKGKTEFVAGKTRIHDVWKAVIGILITPLAIASTAIPEGLLLAITITIAYSTQRMADQQALVRNLSACEEIGSTTVICTNERGTLTFNHLEVSDFWFGQSMSSSVAPNVLELLFEVVVLKDAQVSPGSPIELAY